MNRYPRTVFVGFPVILSILMVLSPCQLPCCHAEQAVFSNAAWIWSSADDPAPKNRFTWFRKVVDLAAVPDDSTLHLAADSNAHVWINGQIVRRKMSRYHEEHITTEAINAGPYLRTGKNVIVVLHHNWGNLITFQRTGNKHAGLYARGTWIVTDATWRCTQAAEFTEHDQQVVGVIGDARIRYPQMIDGRRVLKGDVHDSDFDDSTWNHAIVVKDGPWPSNPTDVETPGQREYPVPPMAVLAAGTVEPQPMSTDPLSVAKAIRTAKVKPDETATREAGNILKGRPWTIAGNAGETHYVTFDFHQPIHGYPFLALDAAEATVVDFGYCEISRSIYSGQMHVIENGWINPEGVVGPGYADRYVSRAGRQRIEIPDERTARWLALHIHFPADGRVTIEDVGIVKSQYPIRPIGSFSCGDERIHQIAKLCLIHAEVSMSDTYVDTPGREDGQWIEDARPRALLAARWFGDIKLLELMIRTLAQGQLENGNLHPFAPSNFPVGPASYDWSVQWVAMLYDHYMWTGDQEHIRRYWPQLLRYWKLVLSLVDDRGIWRTNHLLADIRIGLHPENPKQSSGIVTPWIIERLRWSAQMAEAVGEKEQARQWQVMSDKMAEAFRKYHIVPAGGNIPAHVADRLDPDDPSIERGYSQAGQTIAVTAGLLTADEALADIRYAFPPPEGTPPSGVTRWNNPTYGYRVLRAMSEVGLADLAVAHLIERYSPYLPGHPRNLVPLKLQGPYGGPLPEYWINREDLNLGTGEKCTPQPADETGSHGWGSVPLLWLHDSLLGVRITEPGGGKIRIAPDAGLLPYVAGHTMTPKGIIWVYWDKQQSRLELTIPEGAAAELIMPAVHAGKRTRVVESPAAPHLLGPGRYLLSKAGKYVMVEE